MVRDPGSIWGNQTSRKLFILSLTSLDDKTLFF
jgi:hypothetical protein